MPYRKKEPIRNLRLPFSFNFAGIGGMMVVDMPRPIHITTPIEPLESRIRRLRIPKARQKELRAMIAETRERLAAERESILCDSVQPGEKLESASTAR
jgi:hypothetical protein